MILYVGDQVLLQRRARDAPLYPGLWNEFGGWIEDDETPEAAALREINEELGVSLSASELSPLGAVTVLQGESTVEVYFFSAPLRAKLSELRLGEGSGFALFGFEEIQSLQMPPETKLALDRHYEKLGFGWGR